jgi:hypothetical protein
MAEWAGGSVCSLADALDGEAVDPHIRPIMELHDETTRVGGQLSLA